MKLKSTPQVAAASFSKEIGVKVNMAHNVEPCFTGTTIQIPFFDPTNDTQLNAAWGFIANLGGHIRFNTNENRPKNALASQLYAPISNGFVERQMTLNYPGLQMIFNKLGNLLKESNTLKELNGQEQPLVILRSFIESYIGDLLGYGSYSAVSASNSFVLSNVFGSEISDIVKQGVLKAVNKADISEVAVAVEELSEQLENLLSSEHEDQQGGNSSDNDDGQQQGGNSPDSDDGQQQGGNSSDSDDSQQQGGNSSDSDDGQQQGGNSSNSDGGQQEGNGTSGSNTSDAQKDSLESAIEASKGRSVEGEDKAKKIAELIEPTQNPEPFLCESNIIHIETEGQSVLAQEAQSISLRISNSLEAILSTLTQCKEFRGRTGCRLSSRAGERLARGDSRIFTRMEEGYFPDTSITLLLDMSGSMSKRENKSKLAVLSLALACENINQINVEVMAFQGNSIQILKPFETSAIESGAFDRVESDGGTPLQRGISAAATSLMAMNTERHALWVITDGEAKDNSRELVKQLKSDGVMVQGLFLGALTDKTKTHMKKVFSDDWFSITNVSDLQPKLFDLANELVEPYL